LKLQVVRPSNAEIRTWGRFTNAFPGAFGSGNPWLEGDENLGLDGHLDLFHPCGWSDVQFHFNRYHFDTAEVEAVKGVSESNPFTLHLLAYKFKRGLFRGAFWAAVICLNFGDRRVVFGWLSAPSMDGLMTEFENWKLGDRATNSDLETELAIVRMSK
jgi:hypothetical protein